jgi:hypothetical protein
MAEGVEAVDARADWGFDGGEAVQARRGGGLVIAARKTPRWVDELKAAEGKPSPRTDADGQCEFRYPPAGGEKAYRFVALGDVKKKKGEPGQAEPYQRLETRDYRYRVFVTHLADAVDRRVGLYNQRAGAENLIQEAHNDAGLAAYPSARGAMNGNTCSWPCWPTTSTGGGCCLVGKKRLGRRNGRTPPWRSPGCASSFGRPRSGDTEDG